MFQTLLPDHHLLLSLRQELRSGDHKAFLQIPTHNPPGPTLGFQHSLHSLPQSQDQDFVSFGCLLKIDLKLFLTVLSLRTLSVLDRGAKLLLPFLLQERLLSSLSSP